MFSLTSLKAFKIQNCPGNCQLVFFTLGPFTLRIKKEIFKEMTKKMSEFTERDQEKLKAPRVKIGTRELSLVE